jgi:hypothetical protein
MADSFSIVESALAEAFPDEVDVLTTAVVQDIVRGKPPTILEMEGATKVDVVPIINVVIAASQLGLAALTLYLRQKKPGQNAASEVAESLRQQEDLHDALGKVDDKELLALIRAIQRRMPE